MKVYLIEARGPDPKTNLFKRIYCSTLFTSQAVADNHRGAFKFVCINRTLITMRDSCVHVQEVDLIDTTDRDNPNYSVMPIE